MDPNTPQQPTYTPPPAPTSGGFPLRTVGLIVVLILITATLLYVALTPKTTSVPATPIIPTPTPVAHTTLMLVQNPLVVSTSSASVNVDIDTKGDKVTAVQLEIVYNPRTMGNVDIQPGTFFTTPVAFPKTVDEKTGTISYALGIQPSAHGQTGKGTVAVLTFTPLVKTTPTALSFGPKTQVTAEGVTPSVLKNTEGTTINFMASPSGIPIR